MFIVPADFHTGYRNTMHSVASMALTFSMLEKPTPVTHPCRPVTYQPNTEVRPTARKLVHDVNKVPITDIGSYYLAKGCYLYFTTLHFSHFVISFKKKTLCLTFPLRFTRTRVR